MITFVCFFVLRPIRIQNHFYVYTILQQGWIKKHISDLEWAHLVQNLTLCYFLTYLSIFFPFRMSNETEGVDNYVAFSIEGIALLQVGILGIVGNVAAITVFARQHLQKNFHALMMSLAAFDLLYILASILLFSIPQVGTSCPVKQE